MSPSYQAIAQWQQLANAAIGERKKLKKDNTSKGERNEELTRESGVMKEYIEKMKKVDAAGKKIERLTKERLDNDARTNRIEQSENLTKAKLAQVGAGEQYC